MCVVVLLTEQEVSPVFRDVWAGEQPMYFSEVVARRERPAASFLDFRGCSWAYNDPRLRVALSNTGASGGFLLKALAFSSSSTK